MQLSGYNVVLRDIREDDLEQMRQWRNSPEVSQHMLSQDEISAEQQQAWFKKIQRDGSQQHWIIEYKGTPIGSANIKALDSRDLQTARRVEPGLYIADERYRGNILAFAPTLLMNDFCFEQLKVGELVAVVKSTNLAALKYNRQLGYQLQTQQVQNQSLADAELQRLTLSAKDYQHSSANLKKFLSR